MKYNYLLFIEYKGTDFCGWQKQPGKRTVQSEIEKASEKVFGKKAEIAGASRTDAGVHASYQAANLISVHKFDPYKLPLALNSFLPQDITITKSKRVEDTHIARYCAKEKLYEYRIWNHSSRPVLEKDYVWHVPQFLDISLMKKAAQSLIGRHDFASFSSSKGVQKNRIVHLNKISIKRFGNEVRLEFRADRFLFHMIRNLIGTFVDIGNGKTTKKTVSGILQSKNRIFAGRTAPSSGLILKKIYF